MPEELVQRVRAAEPRLDFVVEQDLLPPMRWPGDHPGDPDFSRSREDEERFTRLLDTMAASPGASVASSAPRWWPRADRSPPNTASVR